MGFSQGNVAKTVHKATGNLPQTALGTLFTITGGKILVLGIMGEVTTIIQAQANATKIVSNPTTGADVDLCASNDINADAVGTFYNITGTLADAMVATTSGGVTAQANPVIVAPGTIDLYCAASSTGQIKWSLIYVPVDSGVSVS